MSEFKDLVVHVDGTERGLRALAAGIALADTFQARLKGVCPVPPPPLPVHAAGVPAVGAGAAAEAQARGAEQAARQRASDAARDFRRLTERARLDAVFTDFDGPQAEVLCLFARHGDLLVACPGEDRGLAGDLAIAAGRPILALPASGEWTQLGTRVLVAWNASREAARALADARPFLARAEKVTLLTVHEAGHETPQDGEPGSLDIVAHLAAHGIEATLEHAADEPSLGDVLLNRAADRGCDLLVMGAYGHSRLRELVFGGATRHVLEHLAVPTLFSH